MNNFSAVKIFSATKASDRAVLGESISAWLAQNPSIEIVDKIVTQSSDSEFHCLSITLFYKQPEGYQTRTPTRAAPTVEFKRPRSSLS